MKPRLHLCSSGQSSWLQIQKSGFDSQRYQIFWEEVGLERGPLSLVSTIEKLLFFYPFIICNLYKYIQQISVRVGWVWHEEEHPVVPLCN
jgi:hypothetical protein